MHDDDDMPMWFLAVMTLAMVGIGLGTVGVVIWAIVRVILHFT